MSSWGLPAYQVVIHEKLNISVDSWDLKCGRKNDDRRPEGTGRKLVSNNETVERVFAGRGDAPVIEAGSILFVG
jgi:hypothetical protein